MYSSEYFNSKFMDFLGYDTCEKLICTSGVGSIITNKIRKQVIPKTHINKLSPASTSDFDCSPHKYNCDILSEDLVSSRFRACFIKKRALY